MSFPECAQLAPTPSAQTCLTRSLRAYSNTLSPPLFPSRLQTRLAHRFTTDAAERPRRRCRFQGQSPQGFSVKLWTGTNRPAAVTPGSQMTAVVDRHRLVRRFNCGQAPASSSSSATAGGPSSIPSAVGACPRLSRGLPRLADGVGWRWRGTTSMPARNRPSPRLLETQATPRRLESHDSATSCAGLAAVTEGRRVVLLTASWGGRSRCGV